MPLMLPRSLRVVLLMSLGLAGCITNAPEPVAAAPDRGQTPAKQPKPKLDETVTIDLKGPDLPDLKQAAGLHRTSAKVSIPPDVQEALAPLTMRGPGVYEPDHTYPASAVGTEPAMLITLGDFVKFDGAFPGENGKWDKWLSGVEAEVRKWKATGRRVQWEIWNEPNEKSHFKGHREDFWSVWLNTARRIRQIDPQAVLVGPSLSHSDYGWIQNFLKACKEYKGDFPDIVCWHEPGPREDIRGHLDGMEETFWQDGSNRRHVRIMLPTGPAKTYRPTLPLFQIADLEKAHARMAFRGVWEEQGFKLYYLLTGEGKLRSVGWMYSQYAALKGMGALVQGSKTVDGVARYDRARKRLTVLLGRDYERGYGNPSTRPSLGELTLVVKGMSCEVARVTVERVGDSGDKAVGTVRRQVIWDVPVRGGEMQVKLGNWASGEVGKVTVE